MLSIAKRTLVGALILLILPAVVWMTGWRWQPTADAAHLRWLYWVTQTVTQPWGIITHVLLCAWFLWCLRWRLKAALVLFALLAAVIVAGQGIKSWIKPWVQEPRPYVIWLEQAHRVPVSEFYALKRHERAQRVAQQLDSEPRVPRWLRHHWQHETGFAFPSGHTMFAASWALLAVGLLWPRRRRLTVALVTAWALAVMGSRLALGMHWPLDLAVATLISWVIVTAACGLTQRICGPLTPPSTERQPPAATVQRRDERL